MVPSTSADEPTQLKIPSKVNPESSKARNLAKRSTSTPNQPVREESDTKIITNLIVKDLIPISFIEGEGFKEFMKIIAPRYAIPSKDSIKSEIDLLYDCEKAAIQKSIGNVRYVSLIINTWEGKNAKDYATIKSQFIDDKWEMKNYILDIVQIKNTTFKNKENQKKIDEIIADYNINGKIVAITCDKSKTKSVCNKENKLGDSIICIAYAIQLCLGFALEEIKKVHDLVKKCNSIVHYFKNSREASEALTDYLDKFKIDSNKLVESVDTRWNSTLLMWQRMEEQRKAISLVLNDRKVMSRVEADKYRLTNEEWEMVKELIKILNPFEKVRRVICDEQYLTASVIRPLLDVFFNPLNDENINNEDNNDNDDDEEEKEDNSCMETIATFKKYVKTELRRIFPIEFEATARGKSIFFATFFDPRHKSLVQEIPELLEMIKAEFQSIAQYVEDKKYTGKLNYGALFPSRKDTAADEIDIYLKEPEIRSNDELLLWWNRNASRYPVLSELAKRYLCISATSVPPKNGFSSDGDLNEAKLKCMSFNKAKKLIFLHHNMGK